MNRERRKANTFEGYQNEKQERREKLIGDYLAVARKSRTNWQYITDLAKGVARHITEVERRKGLLAEDRCCSPATLLRNERYKVMLLSYMAEQPSPGIKNLRGSAISDPRTRLLISHGELERENLRREVERLKDYIVRLENQGGTPHESVLESERDKPLQNEDLEGMKYKFVRTCEAIRLIAMKLPEAVELNVERQQILDAAKRRNNVIVDSDKAGPFFEWLVKQPTQGS